MARPNKPSGGAGKKATGRFESRENLETYILMRWNSTRLSVKEIAAEAEVSRMTALRILAEHGIGPVRNGKSD